jgi:putative ABC transport system substrate-binding protein
LPIKRERAEFLGIPIGSTGAVGGHKVDKAAIALRVSSGPQSDARQRGDRMRRREFIALLGGAAAAPSMQWPVAAHAQQDGPVRRIGILWRGEVTDGLVYGQQDALRQALAKLGWIEDRNVRIDLRYTGYDPDVIRMNADELVGLGPDLIAANSFPVTHAVLQRTRTVPIVFINVGDPVAGGLLKDISRPEGNVTGITSYYQPMGAKLLELLKQVAPRMARAALVFEPEHVNAQFFDLIDDSAKILAVKTVRTPYRSAGELQHAIEAFAAEPNGGLLMVPPPPSAANGDLINQLAVKYRLPAIYSSKYYVAEGGMMSYGAPLFESQRIAATYVDRILRGAKINELPVQFPTRVELVINLKTVKAIGLTVPRQVLAGAEVIE